MLSSTDKTSSPVHDSIISNRRRRTSSSSRHHRRRRRRSDATTTSAGSSNHNASNDFDQACDFLQHFHSIASRSLDAIAEHSESSCDDNDDDEDYLDLSFTRLANSKSRIRKAATCACLSSLEIPTTATTSLVDALGGGVGGCESAFIATAPGNVQQDDEWGFYFEDMASAPSEITPKTK